MLLVDASMDGTTFDDARSTVPAESACQGGPRRWCPLFLRSCNCKASLAATRERVNCHYASAFPSCVLTASSFDPPSLPPDFRLHRHRTQRCRHRVPPTGDTTASSLDRPLTLPLRTCFRKYLTVVTSLTRFVCIKGKPPASVESNENSMNLDSLHPQ